MMRQDERVIVVGAGPVGAVTALALVKNGIPVTLIEAEAEPPEDQRAATIHPPTVAMLAELGLKDEAFAEDASGGMLSPVFHFRDRVSGELVAVFDLGLLKGEVPYPFVVQWEQYKLVRAARPHIEASGIAEVRFSSKVTGLEQSADDVEVTLTNAQGESEKLRGRYLVGADGGRSTVRRFRDPLSRALCGASARRRDLQQGARAARRRRRPRQQSDRRHGHERRHSRRHESHGQACRRLGRPRRPRLVRPLHAPAAQGA